MGGCPSQFAEFLAYARSLKFDAKPDIPYLRKLFRDLFHAQGFAGVGKTWDWDGLLAAEVGDCAGGGAAAQVDGLAVAEVGGGGIERPGTAAAIAPRPTSSWGFSSRQQGEQIVPTGAQQFKSTVDAISRPHTAGGGNMEYRRVDAEQNEGDGIVASARALMRYRHSRATTTNGSVEKDWAAGADMQRSGAPRVTVYQNPSKSARPISSSGGGWVGGGGGSGVVRPKSAGVTSGSLPYGAIKNKIISNAQSGGKRAS